MIEHFTLLWQRRIQESLPSFQDVIDLFLRTLDFFILNPPWSFFEVLWVFVISANIALFSLCQQCKLCCLLKRSSFKWNYKDLSFVNPWMFGPCQCHLWGNSTRAIRPWFRMVTRARHAPTERLPRLPTFTRRELYALHPNAYSLSTVKSMVTFDLVTSC